MLQTSNGFAIKFTDFIFKCKSLTSSLNAIHWLHLQIKFTDFSNAPSNAIFEYVKCHSKLCVFIFEKKNNIYKTNVGRKNMWKYIENTKYWNLKFEKNKSGSSVEILLVYTHFNKTKHADLYNYFINNINLV